MEVREPSAKYLARPGYKQTEVGAVPEDWKVSKLGGHATFKTGPFGSALHQSDYVDGGVPVINPMQIIDGRIQPTPSMAITEQAARKLSEFRLSAGNIIIGRRGDMGRCAFVRTEEHGWLCGTGSMIIRTGPTLDACFIQRVLSSPPIIAEIENASVGSTMINLNQGTLGNLLVPLPPTKAEQEAIAEALSDADALIESLEQLLAKKRHIKQGAMQELLTGKKRLPGFSGRWQVKRLGELFDVFAGGDFDPSRSSTVRDERHPFPVYSNAVTDSGLYGFCAYSAYPASTITVTARGTLGVANFRNHPYTAIGRVLVLQPKLELDGRFLSALINNRITFVIESTGVPQLTAPQISKYVVPTPTCAEQTAIAAILSDMDAEIIALDAKLAKARNLKQGMMQELLTGRIRLI